MRYVEPSSDSSKTIRRLAICAFLLTTVAFVASMPFAALAEGNPTQGPISSPSPAGDMLGTGFADAMIDVSPEEVGKLAGTDGLPNDSNLQDSDNSGFSATVLTSANYKKLMDYALQYKGWKYIFGAKYPCQGGFDCSGLVTWCYDNALGATIDGWTNNAEHIFNRYCDSVPPSYATPGDLVFWRGTYGGDINYISHVGIYCGGNIAYAAGGTNVGYCQIDKVTNIKGQRAQYFFGSLREVDDEPSFTNDGAVMYRMYNRITGEHLYTSNTLERSTLMRGDWNYEGVGWIAPKTGYPVYRLYNPQLGDHHYTMDAGEKDILVRSYGWNDEGVGWYSGGTVPIFRQYNPGLKIGQHNYTANKNENDVLCANHGWQAEGIGWCALQS